MSHFSSHETKYPIPTFSHKDTGSLARRISFSLATFAMGLASAIIAFLALISLFNTGYFLPPRSYEVTITSERMLLKQGLPTLLFMASCLVLIIILLYLSFVLIKIIPDCKIGTFVFLYSLCTTLFTNLNTILYMRKGIVNAEGLMFEIPFNMGVEYFRTMKMGMVLERIP